jgi:periplasmic protein TonB
VRRLLMAAALALAFHSLLFTVRFGGPGTKLVLPPRPLTLSLAEGPKEPLPSLAVSEIPESPAPPPRPPQAPEEKPRPKKTKKPEKPAKEIDPSIPPRQEQASPSSEGRGFAAEEIPASGSIQESLSSPLASLDQGLGRAGRGWSPDPVHEATPLYRLNPVPEYPWIARKRGYQGTVLLEVLVNREGKVKEVTLSASSGYSVLDQAALTSVKAWLFDPGTRGGDKVEMWVKVPVRFQLE